MLGILGSLTASGLRRFRESSSLHAAARAARSQLALARSLAVGRRETVRMRANAAGDLILLDPADSVLAVSSVGRSGDVALDSIRLRPATLRFNARGQAAPGSVYLYRRDRGVRLVSNFLGRIRQENFRLTP